jgi:class 3 adenylate cyclase
MEAFLDVSGTQLVKTLKGESTYSPLHQLEVLVSLFYGAIDDVYIGVDSHPPSRFLKVHPFLLETLASRNANNDSADVGLAEHAECHAIRRVRIVPFSRKELQDDFNDRPDVASDYFDQHYQYDVTLLSVDRRIRDQARNDVLRGTWTSDMGLWLNTAALLFASSLDAASNRLELQLVYPDDARFKQCVRYVRRLIEHAKLVRLRGEKISTEPLSPEDKEHLLWDLDAMFEPGLADVWDEFVEAPKRVFGLGPFVDSHIQRINVDKARVLDAATGTGCDSIYLLEQDHDVTSNEIEHRLIRHAREAATNADVSLNITRFDWRHLEHLAAPESYDVVLALGNSLSCLSTESDVRMVLARFAHLLRPNGLLIVDERNYPVIFKNKKRMLQRNFRFPGRVVYCSTSIQARPAEIPRKPGFDNQMLTLEYLREDGTPVGHFDVLPFAEGQLEGLLEDSGFASVERFYNLEQPNGNREESEFITYVASRSFVESGLESGTAVDVVVAFTDVSGSTPVKRKLGEKRYAREWKKHESRVRKLVKSYGGSVVNDTGDGFLLSFQAPEPALQCLKEIVRSPGTEALTVRAGLNRGSVTQDERGNLRGREVDVAARICDQARPDHVVADDRIKLATPDDDWMAIEPVELEGAGTRKLWRLAE